MLRQCCNGRLSALTLGLLLAPFYLVMAFEALSETSRGPQSTGLNLLIDPGCATYQQGDLGPDRYLFWSQFPHVSNGHNGGASFIRSLLASRDSMCVKSLEQ